MKNYRATQTVDKPAITLTDENSLPQTARISVQASQ